MLAIFSLKSGLIIRTHHTHSIRCEPTFRGLSAPGKGHFLGRGDILGYAQAYSRSTYSKLFAWGQRIAMRPLANIDVATRSNYYSRLSYLEANVGVSAGSFTCTDRRQKPKNSLYRRVRLLQSRRASDRHLSHMPTAAEIGKQHVQRPSTGQRLRFLITRARLEPPNNNERL